MKKIIFGLFAFMAFASVNAQTDSLQQYTGKFVFPSGSPVAEVSVVVENGVLIGISDMGSSEFKKIAGDEFEIVAYAGIATYKRDKEGKINALRIQVQDIDMEGQKSEKASIAENRIHHQVLIEFIRK